MPHEWRNHPKLRGRLQPQHPDDVQVIVHDGGPRMTERSPELVWVRIEGSREDVFRGRALNQPHQLSSVAQGDQVLFVVPDGGEHPVMVTDKYLRERPDWVIQPCPKCGLSELFDAPSDLVRVLFPDVLAGAVIDVFTTFCGGCGGVQVVQRKDAELDAAAPPKAVPKWRRFWR